LSDRKVEQVTTDLGVDLLEDIGSNGEVHLLDSLVSDGLTDNVVVVADVLVGRVLSLVGKE
jgi:hypothetical protein